MTRALRSPSRGLAAAATVGALLLTPLAVTGALTPAAVADAAADCATPVDVSTLSKGDTVTALSVVSGTTPEEFPGTVLGVVTDGIAPGVDLVMIDFGGTGANPAMDDAGGIWQGMSGSPVYVGDPADGNIVGAIAYGLSYGPSPIAGVTPFSAMDGYLPSASTRSGSVDVTGAEARAISRADASTTTAQAAQGFRRLGSGLTLSGVDATTLATARKAAAKNGLTLATRKFAAASGTAGRAADTTVDDVAAGGNLAASVAYGDITMAGVGTSTSVCGGEVVAFGHPLIQAGEVTYGLHPADAVYIQPDPAWAPFKMANLGDPVGTITQDRLTGITGELGVLPDVASVTSSYTAGSTSKDLSTDVYTSDYLPDVTFYSAYTGTDLVLDGDAMGTQEQTWTITGSHDGEAFTLTGEDTFASSSWWGGYTAAADTANLVYYLGRIDGVEVDSVDVTATQTSEEALSWRVVGVEQRLGGTWKRVTRKHDLVLREGTLHLRAVVRSGGETAHVALPVDIDDVGRGSGYGYVTGGDSLYSRTRAATFEGFVDKLDARVANDEVRLYLRIRGAGTREVVGSLPRDGVVKRSQWFSVTGGAKG
ncbi:hypothetical protein [Nocardioides sp. GY 10127]|uniref:hypothetical protein n=1 Tax=Nocardioides sp. GY 10127 TaxID=2569762 RepID=UPI0010A84512|nr:hypothetical protein [Nocardioides sp. GY 10127]TIC86442.1 hypothetical protein E8D37_00590 [Nocardioides sp. GY 10127]